MTSLHDTQRLLHRLITAQESVEQTLQQAGQSTDELEAVLVGDTKLSAVGRLEIYANMYFFRIRDVLRGDFPNVAAAVGEDGFHDLVTAYLQKYPSRHPSLRWVGERLPAFAREAHSPWLGDLAALEWARHDVFDAADEPLLTMEALRALAPDAFVTLPMKLVEAARLVAVDYAVDDLWSAEPEADAGEPVRSARTILVWREDTSVYHRALPEADIRLVRAIVEGTTFGRVCDLLCETVAVEDAPTQAFTLLATLANDSLLVA